MDCNLSHFLVWLAIVFVVTPLAIILPPIVARRYGGELANTLTLLLVQVLAIATPFFYIWFLTGRAFWAPFVALTVGLLGSRLAFGALIHGLIGAETLQANMRKSFLIVNSEPVVQRAIAYARNAVFIFGFCLLGYFS